MRISHIPVEAVLADIARLTSVRRLDRVMAPEQPFEPQRSGSGSVREPIPQVARFEGIERLFVLEENDLAVRLAASL